MWVVKPMYKNHNTKIITQTLPYISLSGLRMRGPIAKDKRKIESVIAVTVSLIIL